MKMRFDRRADEGIALVITLIMLAVTLVMAVAFLAISTRERGSVTTSTDANHARLATEAALAHAEAQVAANILATKNPYNFGLFVSTNYINRSGFNEGLGPNLANVNYDFTSGGVPLSPGDLMQNIANLEYLPRAPVFVPTNSLGYNDFRFYLDLNRNRQFDDTGPVPNWMFINGTFTTNTSLVNEIGDPQWIGVLEHPDQPHGPANHFIARYAFIAIPVGNTLDVNAIYNDADLPFSDTTMKPTTDAYLRNQGVGSWELNLAAFLADLNPDEWDQTQTGNGYNYNTPNNRQNNIGAPFEDALSILRYRYDNSLYNQPSIKQLYSNFGLFQNNLIDNYSDGPLMTNGVLPYGNDNPVNPWAGADNTNHFFGLSDFFNPLVAGTNLVNRLLNSETSTFGGTQVPTYDRYTFYRMLAQLGSDSEPQVGKVNINYTNVDIVGDVVPGQAPSLVPWGTNALGFFTTAADAMLKAYTTNWSNNNLFAYTNTFGAGVGPFGVNNIPVWVNGHFVYSPSVQRILQLAANIYDATTNGFYPHVFRPSFSRDSFNNVFITSYNTVDSVSGANDPNYFTIPVDPAIFAASGGTNIAINIYGVPWIIGAKQGFPNFNEFSMETVAQVTRKIEVVKSAPGSGNLVATNVAWIFGISNAVGVECWNSYTNAYPFTNQFTIAVSDNLSMTLETTNGFVLQSLNSILPAVALPSPLPSSFSWSGSTWQNNTTPPLAVGAPFSFKIPLLTNITFLPNSYYQFSPQGIFPESSATPGFQPLSMGMTLPQMVLVTTNRLQFLMLDGSHVIDYVQFGGPDSATNLNAVFQSTTNASIGYGNWWGTTLVPTGPFQNIPVGIVSQIYVSETPIPGIDLNTYWGTSQSQQQYAEQMIEGFAQFMTGASPYPAYAKSPVSLQYSTNTTAQTPYTPTFLFYNYTTYQANDPLVHYMTNDLTFNGTDYGLPTGLHVWPMANGNLPILPDIGQLNTRYAPWGVRGPLPVDGDQNSLNLAYKDPLVFSSDNWNFPTNPFPNIGWLGRVHRGTPWQTVYLKSTNILGLVNYPETGASANGLDTWAFKTGNLNPFDATNTAPVSDRLLFDLFTAAPNQNATLGQLSVNQTNFAAWSAVFSGVPVLTNLTGTNMTIFDHAGTNGINSYLGKIWSSIQDTRNNQALFPLQAFTHLGDVLATPALSDHSPFLPWYDLVQSSYGISDEMYEWLPQQTLGLLKVGTPRYVVYCYGQALKPAQNGVLSSGNYALMCTNYTVVSESAVRAVVEIQGATGNTPHVILKNVNPLPPE